VASPFRTLKGRKHTGAARLIVNVMRSKTAKEEVVRANAEENSE
jgi:hypothetical protein